MPTPSEFDLQKALCGWLDGWPDRNNVPRKTPALAPGVVYWHTPNGGRRDAHEARRFKESGVKAGVHDLLFLRPTQFESGVWGLLFGLELKEPGGSQPPEKHLNAAQRIMHPRMLAAGMAASVTLDDLAAAKAWCIHYQLARNVC